jgi:dolichol-phosphate mannosyltransferase
VLALIPCFDEAARVGLVLAALPGSVAALVVDDGSSDGTGEVARQAGAEVLRLESRRGVGAALRAGFGRALAGGFDAVVVLAGNGKDDPRQVPALLEPLEAGLVDLVQGSRWLARAPRLGAMPRYRRLATRLHPLLFGLATGQFATDTTNGFRAVSRAVLSDPRLGLDDARLDGYQLEPTLYARAIALGYRTVEVPVRKVYPRGPGGRTVTKMPAGAGWAQLLTPLVHAGLARLTGRLEHPHRLGGDAAFFRRIGLGGDGDPGPRTPAGWPPAGVGGHPTRT